MSTAINLYILLNAICLVESGGDPLAYNYRDGKGTDNHSIGYCQVTYNTARELGMPRQDSCKRDLRMRYRRTEKQCKLFSVTYNKGIAYRYLQKQQKRYGNSIELLAAAYNAGSVLYSRKTGKLVNRKYVRMVQEQYSILYAYRESRKK